jgi:type III secretion system low calcium response chaperone LcrH/SycD
MMPTKEMIKSIIDDKNTQLDPKLKEVLEKVLTGLFIEGKSPAVTMGFTPEMLEEFYSYALNFYRLGHYEQAKNIFMTALFLAPENWKYAQGLAMTFHRLKDYPKAVDYYLLWSQLDYKNPIPFYHMSDCLEHLNKSEDRRYALIRALQRCGSNPEFAHLKTKLELELDYVKADVEEAPMGKVSDGGKTK